VRERARDHDIERNEDGKKYIKNTEWETMRNDRKG
jgi:hypothetical protein